ncbi:hypothetical protein [Cerasicoccus arenae]|uniref:PEP-CTERM sorting domain-containing protein n=1 Tax=Cerasicoccus arenae TaxID=424488 RepID=A0A8J3DEY9_9BACT|nr:hypothetical protein [Cerasicoccus arenae]MBK1859783.1 hypothetical protein [Cerasicoccus arenae]GHC13138.1 hypothetical protein GCM10007047_33050 [Cerasicoccus arenae]
MIKNVPTAFCASCLFVSGLSAGLIVNGDISSDALTSPQDAATYTLQSSEVNAGWVSSDSVTYNFNALSTVIFPGSDIASIQYASTSGNPGGFYLGENVTSLSQSTSWNLFTLAGDVFELSIDVAVLDSYVNNDTLTYPIGGAVTGNSANLSVALYGFSGDLTALSSALATDAISIDGNNLAAPTTGFTALVSPTSLSAVGSLNTWETQSFSISGNYTYYLFGLSGVSGGVQGVSIDNVIVAVPEVSTYISGLGFILLGCFLYRHRRLAVRKV